MRLELLRSLALITALLMSVVTYSRLRGGALGFRLLDRDTVLGHLVYFAWSVAITLVASRWIGRKGGHGWLVRSLAMSVVALTAVFAFLAFTVDRLSEFEEFARFELARGSFLAVSAITALLYFLSRRADSDVAGSAPFTQTALALGVSSVVFYGAMRLLADGEHARNVRQFVAVAAGLYLPALFLFATRAKGLPKPASQALGAVLLLAAAWL